MDNENELMKEFNETFNKKEEPVEAYRATSNNNIMFEQKAVNNDISNNQNINMPNYENNNNLNDSINVINQNLDISNNNIVNNNEVTNLVQNSNVELYNTSDLIQGSNQELYSNYNQVNYSQNVTKKKKTTVKINPELKGIFILVLVLLLAMSFIPTLFDLFNDLKIKIFG